MGLYLSRWFCSLNQSPLPKENYFLTLNKDLVGVILLICWDQSKNLKEWKKVSLVCKQWNQSHKRIINTKWKVIHKQSIQVIPIVLVYLSMKIFNHIIVNLRPYYLNNGTYLAEFIIYVEMYPIMDDDTIIMINHHWKNIWNSNVQRESKYCRKGEKSNPREEGIKYQIKKWKQKNYPSLIEEIESSIRLARGLRRNTNYSFLLLPFLKQKDEKFYLDYKLNEAGIDRIQEVWFADSHNKKRKILQNKRRHILLEISKKLDLI